jgi:hypothetical protein
MLRRVPTSAIAPTEKSAMSQPKGNAPAGSNARKIADFYHSYLDDASMTSTV